MPTERVLQAWREAIEKNGSSRMKVRALMGHFGFERRSQASVAKIEGWLEERGLFVMDLPIAGIDDPVILTSERIEKIGELVEKESDIEKRFVGEMMTPLGLTNPNREHSPRGTRDRLDFLCLDAEGRSVVVELKRGSGERRAVEQVLRYIAHLEHEGNHKDPRALLITGYGDSDTRRALEACEKGAQIRWFLYGLVHGEVRLKEMEISRAHTPAALAGPQPPSRSARNPSR